MVGFIMEIFDGSKKVYSSAESNRAESATNKQTYFYKGFNVVGDSVKIRLEKNVPLHLAEVFVMGCPDTTPTPVAPTPVPAATCTYKRDTWIVTNKDVAIRSVSSRNYLDGRAPSNNDAWLTNRPPKNDKYLNWRLVPVPGASETYVYGLKSISSNKFLDGRNRSFASKNGAVLVTPGNPQTNKYLQWKVENMGNGAYALRSISSGLYLDGRNPNHLGNQVWLTPRKPQGDKYLQWHFETCQGGSTPKPTPVPVTPKPTPISCGYGKTAGNCAQCVVGGSPAGCSGQCAWSNSSRKCVPRPPGGIYQCGDHQASSCGQCGISPNIKLTGMYYTNTYVPDSHEILNVSGPIGAVQRYDLRKMRGDRHVPKGQVSIQVWTNASASIKSRVRNHLIKNVAWRNKYCANAHPRHPAQIQVAGIGFTRRSWVPGYVILFSQTQFIFISTDNRFQMPFTRATDAQKRQWIR